MLGLGNTLSGGIVPAVPLVPITALTNAKSIAFDGTNDLMTNAGNLALDLGTFALWVKNAGDSGTMGMQVVLHAGSSFRVDLFNGVTDGSQPIYPSTSHPAMSGLHGYGVAGVNYLDNEWHFIAFTVEGGGSGAENTGKLYSDGELIKTVTRTATYTAVNAPFEFDNVWSYWYEGSVDEVSIWKDVALSGAAIATLYNEGVPIDLSEDGGNYSNSGDLDHWWRMGDGDSFPTIEDAKGSYDLTMTNMAEADIEDEVPD